MEAEEADEADCRRQSSLSYTRVYDLLVDTKASQRRHLSGAVASTRERH